jgi:predicted unusual protein kinase regulating ubiquinone biosynthesis (AarF/ABC1/UbiB family)
VKIQYPRLRETLSSDLKTLDILVKFTEFCFPKLKLKWIVEEFKENLPAELDFIREGENNDRFNRDFAHLPNVHAPKIYWVNRCFQTNNQR